MNKAEKPHFFGFLFRINPKIHITHVTKGDKWIKKISAISFFVREQLHEGRWASSPGWSPQRQGQGLHTVPKRGRLWTACSHQPSSDIRQCEMTSWIQDPSRKCSQKQRGAGLGGNTVELLQEVHSAIQGKRRCDLHSPAHNPVQTCLSYNGTPGLEDRICIETSGRAVEGIQGPDIPCKRRGTSVGLSISSFKFGICW